MHQAPKAIPYLLFLGIALCLMQIWVPRHYLTCDGPCHLANASILRSIGEGTSSALYNQFYTVDYSPNPNSTTTFALASLLQLFKGAVAEKVFLSAYLLIFIGGFCALLRKLTNSYTFWQLAGFLFIFTYALSKGFYNFSFGIAFYCWMLWAWLLLLDRANIFNVILFFLFSAVTFFTHLLPFVFGAITCAALLLSYTIACARDKSVKTTNFLLHRGLILCLTLLPFILLSLRFTNNQGGLNLQLRPHPYRILELVQFKYAINITDAERPWAYAAGVLFTVLFSYLLVKILPRFTLHKYDGLFLSLLVFFLVYTFFPEDFMGRAIIISIRAQLFVFIIVACCIAYRMPEGSIKNFAAFVFFIFFIILSSIRLECRQEADKALDDYLSVSSHIRPGATILPLDFAPTGKDNNGNPIAARNAIFHHAAQYLAVEKTLIILDNYEANIGYFPISWKPDVNPYTHLSTGNGLEALPPSAGIENYEQTTGKHIDNILLWCYNPSYLTDTGFRALYNEINNRYHITYTSPSGRAVLYSRNK